MNRLRYFFQKALSFLRVRVTAGGLEITDQVLRLVYFDGKTSQMAAARLEPGVMEKGKIKNAAALVASLTALRAGIKGIGRKKKMNVVVSLSSVNMYSQVFTLPIIEGQDLDEAIKLNVQMLSPTDVSGVYSGWQLLGRDEAHLRLELSAAFVEKQIVDEMVPVLSAAGFVTVAVESRALALVRVLKEKGSGVDNDKAYIVVKIDNTGIDFLIVRKGQLYFEYSNQWADLADEKGQIGAAAFEESLTASLRQVANFHDQHWPEPLAAIMLSASAFEEIAERGIAGATSLPVIRLSITLGQPISSEWLVALGASVRGSTSAGRDKEINLLGENAAASFEKEQLINFLNLWRVLVPVAFGLLVLTFVLANLFLADTKSTITSDTNITIQPADAQQMSALEASSTDFNQLVALVQSAETMQTPKYIILTTLEDLAASSSVTIESVSFQGAGTPAMLTGSADSEDAIGAFKDAIAANSHFGPVTLPLTGITESGQSYLFSMTFPASP
jgi:hypothetical protein